MGHAFLVEAVIPKFWHTNLDGQTVPGPAAAHHQSSNLIEVSLTFCTAPVCIATRYSVRRGPFVT
jgi:hypothetical protein